MSMIDSIIGNSPQILALRAQRLELISGNLANADTPGFKARDVDFGALLSDVQNAGQGGQLKRTHERHMDTSTTINGDPAVMYRIPHQPSANGNTVESVVEKTEFMDNAIRYQASLNMLDGRIKSTLRAIRGD